MLRILLTDDEPLTVDAMEYMIRKRYGDHFIMEKAYSGKEAIETSMNSRLDIVVMDIDMPGIDGMEAIRNIKGMYQDVHFLIVTAMEYFDYAVESVKIEEIDEYILKPVRKEVFLEAIDRTARKIEDQRLARKKVLQMEEQMQMVLPILEKNFIGTIGMAEDVQSDIREFCQLFSITDKYAYIMIVEFGSRSDEGIQNGIGSGIRGTKYYKEYCNLLKRLCSCIIGDIIRNRMVILVHGDFKEGSYEEKQRSISMALRLLQQAERFGNEASVSIGSIHPVLEVKASYNEAMQASRHYMDYTEDTRIYHIEDITEVRKSSVKIDEAEKLLCCIRKGDSDKALAEIQDIYLKLRGELGKEGLSGVKNHTLYLLAHVYDEYKKTESAYIKNLEKIIKGKSIGEMQNICESYVLDVIRQIYVDKEEKIEGIMEQANQYMLEHLNEKISLKEISRAVNLSEYYFSRLYKSVTGKNYSDQLICFRMEKAKRLIGEKKYTVWEIGELVGYPDPNYLSKVFKKYTGMTISDYKNRDCEM